MAGALLGYFFYATTAFVATMVLLTGLLDDPRLGEIGTPLLPQYNYNGHHSKNRGA